MDKNKTLVTIFREDKIVLENFMKENEERIPTMADAIRVCVQYASSHGALL